MISREVFARPNRAARGSLLRNGESAFQGKSSIPEFHHGIVRVEPEASNPALSWRELAGDFRDRIPRNESLLVSRWTRVREDSILRDDRWPGSL